VFSGVSDLENEVRRPGSGNSLILHLRVNSTGCGKLQKDFCTRITPVWKNGPEGIFLDLRGLSRIYGPWADGAVSICQLAQREFPVQSAGLATSELSARLASLSAACGNGSKLLAVPCVAVSSFLAGFSVQVLKDDFREIPRLIALGVRTLGDLQILPENLLKAVFGSAGQNLSQLASGMGADLISQVCSEPERQLVLWASFKKPLVSTDGERALRRALATRIMPRELDCGRWFLSVQWSSGARAVVNHMAAPDQSWSAWLALIDGLWARLPAHRQGICHLELHFQRKSTRSSHQMALFKEPGGSLELSRAIIQIRRKFDPDFTSASEALLMSWGAVWGP